MVDIFDGLSTIPMVRLLTTVRAKLSIHQVEHNLNFRSVKMTLHRIIEAASISMALLPTENAGEFWIEVQTGMQRIDANTSVVNVPLSGTYILVLSKH
jgi:hypothetical protein